MMSPEPSPPPPHGAVAVAAGKESGIDPLVWVRHQRMSRSRTPGDRRETHFQMDPRLIQPGSVQPMSRTLKFAKKCFSTMHVQSVRSTPTGKCSTKPAKWGHSS